MGHRIWAATALLAGLAVGPAGAQAVGPPPETTLEPVTVVANAPLPGAGGDADKMPGEVQTLSLSRLSRDRQDAGLANTVAAQLSSVSLNSEQGSPYQPDFVFRGFEASPISGVAQGLAVYQDGVRMNESFGDTVNWDLVPEFAVDSLTVQSNNPVFGLNTLGGAVTLAMKDGLGFHGVDAELSGGSFGAVAANLEAGGRRGDFGLYLGLGGAHDDGFRYASPTTVRQAYGDLVWRRGGLTLHLTASAAGNDIDAAGPTPVQMLARDRRAIFTSPQAMQNRMAMVQLRGAYAVSDRLTLSASAYDRRFDQRLVDGNTTNVAYCQNDPAQLCLQGDGQYPKDALYDSHGQRVPASVLPAGATPGETDVTRTRTDAVGGAIQLSLTAPLAGRANSLVVGASIDHGSTDYAAHGALGWVTDSLRVVGAGVIIDQGKSPTASPPIETPVGVEARNAYAGVYATDALDLTPRLTLTLSGRLNLAEVDLRDRLGEALNGRHSFSRFNPGAGATYKLTPNVTAYVGYSESNRAPTAGELSCADPASPCLLDAFLVSDPPLKQVVSHTYEAGLRGHIAAGPGGTLTWSVSGYRTDVDDDILLLASGINGFGYFQNAGRTRRQGVDARLAYQDRRLTLSASYSFLDATFQTAQLLSSNSPAADGEGLIQVRAGDRMPLNPAHRLTLSADYAVTKAWSVGGDLRWQSDQYLAGDESNAGPTLPGFATVGLRTAYQVTPRLQLYAEVRNLFDERYATYGAFAALDGLPPRFRLTDPRTFSPSPPRSATLGARLRFD